jgi:hypothetical protein
LLCFVSFRFSFFCVILKHFQIFSNFSVILNELIFLSPSSKNE